MSRFDALFKAARDARANAHAPYSRFAVGAAVLSEDGRIFAGCNVENASFPEGWCAETTAIGAMVAAGGRRIVEAVVTADAALCTPCGGCRQRLAEFASSEAVVHVCDTVGLKKSFRLGELLPAGFVLHGEDRKS